MEKCRWFFAIGKVGRLYDSILLAELTTLKILHNSGICPLIKQRLISLLKVFIVSHQNCEALFCRRRTLDMDFELLDLPSRIASAFP